MPIVVIVLLVIAILGMLWLIETDNYSQEYNTAIIFITAVIACCSVFITRPKENVPNTTNTIE